MRTWLKDHERWLWWGFLMVSIIVGQIRHPECSDHWLSVWTWVPVLIVFAFFGFMWWYMMRALRKDRNAS